MKPRNFPGRKFLRLVDRKNLDPNSPGYREDQALELKRLRQVRTKKDRRDRAKFRTQ